MQRRTTYLSMPNLTKQVLKDVGQKSREKRERSHKIGYAEEMLGLITPGDKQNFSTAEENAEKRVNERREKERRGGKE